MNDGQRINTEHDGEIILPWTSFQKIIFRIAFVFIGLLSIPLDWKFYRKLFAADWSSFRFQSLFEITAYTPQFISAERLPAWGWASFLNLAIALFVSAAAGLLWSVLDRKKKEYSQYYYWIRLIARVRLSLGIIAYGFIKIFPLQMPYPALSDLHTAYGDFLKWKIYYLSAGAGSAYYEPSLGLLEVAGGILLLFRRTSVIGAGIVAAILFNVALANFAYDLGNHTYCVYLIILAFFVMAYDIPRLYQLLALEKPALATPSYAFMSGNRLIYARRIGRLLLFLFISTYGVSVYASYRFSAWPFSDIPGLKGKSGYYNVSSFRINNRLLPYSYSDSLRWQDVVLEKWNTLSIKINRPVVIDGSAPSIAYQNEKDRNYEQAGNGGRHYYSYTADTLARAISLWSKERPAERFSFIYSFPDDSTIELSGKNMAGDSLGITLNRIDKKYLLQEGNRKPIKL